MDDEKLLSSLKIEDGQCRPFKFLLKNKVKAFVKGDTINIFLNPKTNSDIYSSEYSQGVMFYLMVFLSLLTFIGFLYSNHTN